MGDLLAVFLLLLVMSGAGCASFPPVQADASVPPIVVRIEPTEEFVDSGVDVQKGNALLFAAIGQIEWDSQAKTVTSTPDGINPWIGVKVGRGGLVGRIGPTGKPFDIGGRTTLFKNPNIHSHRYHPPPPIVMQSAGRLFLGFKDFRPDHHHGAYEVTIRRAQK